MHWEFPNKPGSLPDQTTGLLNPQLNCWDNHLDFYDYEDDDDDTFDDHDTLDDDNDEENNEESNDGGDASLRSAPDEILYRQRTTPDGPCGEGTQKHLPRYHVPVKKHICWGQKTHRNQIKGKKL